MLLALHIKGLGVIEDLSLELHDGLNVLTGETGAGKTMVTVGLGLALGGRASASLVRQGHDEATVEALFDSQEKPDPAELLLTRSVSAAGRGSARISGELATATMLAAAAAALVEVHGQGQTQRLLRSDVQTELLDRFVGAEHLDSVAAYRAAFDELRSAEASLAELRARDRDRERERDLVAYQVREIEGVTPAVGERERLEADELRLSHVERLLETMAEVVDALSGSQGSAEAGGAADRLAVAVHGLDDAVVVDPALAPVLERVRSLAVETEDVAHDVRGYLAGLAHDPEALERVRQRIGQLNELRRKYGDTTEGILTFLAAGKERLDLLEDTGAHLAALEARREELASTASAMALALTAARSATGPSLAAELTQEITDLGMPGSRIDVTLAPESALTREGAEHVELALAAAADQPFRSLATTASGGELSRVMLACRSVLTSLDRTPTLVFDEIDAGIGGRAGLAVGRRLAKLARDRQVLVVTHLPQIACFADRHIRITKEGNATTASTLDDRERVAELARMLAGLQDSSSAHTHARELLEEADRVRSEAIGAGT